MLHFDETLGAHGFLPHGIGAQIDAKHVHKLRLGRTRSPRSARFQRQAILAGSRWVAEGAPGAIPPGDDHGNVERNADASRFRRMGTGVIDEH